MCSVAKSVKLAGQLSDLPTPDGLAEDPRSGGAPVPRTPGPVYHNNSPQHTSPCSQFAHKRLEPNGAQYWFYRGGPRRPFTTLYKTPPLMSSFQQLLDCFLVR